MMNPTHIGVGLVVAAPTLILAPEFVVPAAIGGMAGGVLPDLDLFVGRHRRTLHFPEAYWLAAIPLLALAAIRPTALTVAVAVAVVSMAVHSGMDWFGAGDELEPWERTSSEAVYLHLRGRWLQPKYWVRYDGAAEDLAITVVCSLAGLLFPAPIPTIAAINVAVAVLYALVRKRVPAVVDGQL
ncbi:metal-dependent hydrolase [Halonotius terrestris]|uniref:Metal-dependent hydrolase n=1 Tax=Halonotius terrestris TaxID=2487750 RepID=A0A8J8TCQ1_9EURY|nr:metal-dependent hydrolase [Halonotius terrestris]TQQ81096.1 metal-dependent hydrolase [Halonotius terrestris]